MKIIPTPLPDIILLAPINHQDERGFFMESFHKKNLSNLGINFDCDFIQDNHSLSREAGTLRGLHFQNNPKAQTKYVRCTRGAIWDVVVDIRRTSPTYGKWHAEILSAHNKRILIVPKGFAHGLVTLVPDTEVLYKVDDYYSPECDRSILWNDPELNITWPVDHPKLSKKDLLAPTLNSSDHNFEYQSEKK
jgi:dTDP-4-dehydrorhamnose 3,5-epimerase